MVEEENRIDEFGRCHRLQAGIFWTETFVWNLKFFRLKDMKQNNKTRLGCSRPNVETGPAEAQRELVEPELFGATEWMGGQLGSCLDAFFFPHRICHFFSAILTIRSLWKFPTEGWFLDVFECFRFDPAICTPPKMFLVQFACTWCCGHFSQLEADKDAAKRIFRSLCWWLFHSYLGDPSGRNMRHTLFEVFGLKSKSCKVWDSHFAVGLSCFAFAPCAAAFWAVSLCLFDFADLKAGRGYSR